MNKYDEKILSMNDICDMWPHLMLYVEDMEIEELDCSDRYLLKDSIEAFLNTLKEEVRP